MRISANTFLKLVAVIVPSGFAVGFLFKERQASAARLAAYEEFVVEEAKARLRAGEAANGANSSRELSVSQSRSNPPASDEPKM